MVVQSFIQRADVKIDIRMCLCKCFNTFRCRNDAEEMDLSTALLLKQFKRRYGRTARGQHGIDDKTSLSAQSAGSLQ